MSTYQTEHFPLPTPGRLRRELRLPRPPWWMVALLLVIVIGTWIPLIMIGHARRTQSRQTRVQLVLDMDKQPRRGPQAGHAWFQDGRAMRLPVADTIARGQLSSDDHWHQGYTQEVDPSTGVEQIRFFDTLPPQLTVGPELLNRGRERYGIFCAPCHGASGQGDGPIHRRATELQEAKWVPPTNLITPEIRQRLDGQLYQAIRDGVRNMPGYAAQIDPQDRWAIVAWVRELHSAIAPSAEEQQP